MSDDFYLEMGKKRWADLDAQRAQELANLQAAKASYDEESAAAAIQNIANLDAERANLTNLYDNYIRSNQPPPQPTKEERAAKPWERMNYSDVWEMSKSKYGPPDEAKFREGIAEANRRRARGE
jgi:multidrug efflux pump subunit AcrA (membrane-fusion protein)